MRNPSEPRKLGLRGAILDVAWAGTSEQVAYAGGLGKEVRSSVSLPVRVVNDISGRSQNRTNVRTLD